MASLFDEMKQNAVLMEDFVEYHLYIDELDLIPEDKRSLFKFPLEDFEALTLLQAKQTIYMNFLQQYTRFFKNKNHQNNNKSTYIWQNEPFDLKKSAAHQRKDPASNEAVVIGNDAAPVTQKTIYEIYGKTRLGENLEDEWFIVFLLKQLSQQFPEITVAVRDNDGEFLLIEAAHVIPKWLSPENSENRNFIHKGKLHIVPLIAIHNPAQIFDSLKNQQEQEKEQKRKSSSSNKNHYEDEDDEDDENEADEQAEEEEVGINLIDALYIIKGDDINTEASAAVQKMINIRIKDYPQRAFDNLHLVRCFLPLRIALILKKQPQMIAYAVRAFIEREPSTLKYCSKMENFPPNDATQGCVMTMVCMTRFLYAQLLYEDFQPPAKVFPKLPRRTHKDYQAISLGTKIACGFEIMTKLAQAKQSKISQEGFSNATREDLEDKLKNYPFDSDVKWKEFHTRLSQYSYYGEEMEGSQKWKELDREAKISFLKSVQLQKQSRKEAILLRELSEPCEATVEQYKEELCNDDSDEWLTTGEDVRTLLTAKAEQFEAPPEDKPAAAPKPQPTTPEVKKEDNSKASKQETAATSKSNLEKAQDLVQGMKAFVNTKSSFKGVQDFDQQQLDKLLAGAFSGLELNDLDDGEAEGFGDDYEGESLGENKDDLKMSDEETLKIMREMDEELRAELNQAERDNDLETGDEQLDEETKLLKNLLKSFKAQAGGPGPLSNMMAQMGLSQLPEEEEEDLEDDDEDDIDE